MVVASAGTYRHIRRFERGLPAAPKARFDWTRTLQAWGELIFTVRNTRALFFGLLLATTMGSCFRSLNLHFGLITFGSKVASGLGKVVSGWMLERVSFPDVKSGMEVGYDVVSDLALYAGVFCAVTGLAGLVVLSTFRLTRARHSEIVTGLRERDRLVQSAEATG